MKRVIALSVLGAALSFTTAASAGTLQLNIAFKGAETRAVWENLIKQFEQAKSGVTTKLRSSKRKPTRFNCRLGSRR